MITLTSCKITREEIDAVLWTHTKQIPKELCDANPQLWKHGLRRKLNNGQNEFVPYCAPEIELYLSVYSDDLNRILDENLPKPNQP
jgi:hypothetical protein